MAEFLAKIPLFPVLLTIGTYILGVWVKKKTKLPLFNPILIAVALTIGVLLLTGFDVSAFQFYQRKALFIIYAQIIAPCRFDYCFLA